MTRSATTWLRSIRAIRLPDPAVAATLALTGTRLVLPVRQDSETTVS